MCFAIVCIILHQYSERIKYRINIRKTTILSTICIEKSNKLKEYIYVGIFFTLINSVIPNEGLSNASLIIIFRIIVSVPVKL